MTRAEADRVRRAARRLAEAVGTPSYQGALNALWKATAVLSKETVQ